MLAVAELRTLAPARERRRCAPGSWPATAIRHGARSSAATRRPARSRSTRRSRSPRAQPSCATISSLLPWLAVGPIFLREAGAGRSCSSTPIGTARARAAVGALPFVLNLIARDQATTDRWTVAEAAYREAIDLARESDQQTALAFALAGLAWLQARRGRVEECRAHAAEALALCEQLGTRLHQVWASAALGELELGLGDAAGAAAQFELQQQLLGELGDHRRRSIAGSRARRGLPAARPRRCCPSVGGEFLAAARAKGQPWSLARALRSQGLLAGDGDVAEHFDQALALARADA